MVKGIIYNPNVEELAKEQSGYMERLWKFNQLKPSRGRQESQINQDKFRKYKNFCKIMSKKRLTSGEKKHMIIPVNIHIRQ